jgi:hypothetical protein
VSLEYPFLNTIGVASINGVNPFLLIQLNKLGQQLGKPIDVFSGYRSPGYSERVGGYRNDPHARGEAVDAQINGTPIGLVVPLATLAGLGLEGGNTPNFYPAGGGADPEHVQIPGSGVNKSMRSPTLHLATGNPASGNVPPPDLATLPFTPGSAPPTSEIPNATRDMVSGAVDPIAAVLTQAGFSGEGLRTAYAIVKRESGGKPTALNDDPSTGDLSYGLFQINMLGRMGPARRAQFGIKTNQALLDPLTNAKAAFQMSKGGTDFGPWGLGPNAYRNVPLDMSVVPANLGSGGATYISDAAGPTSSAPGPSPPSQPQPPPYVPPTPPALSPLPATPAAATPVITLAPLPADKPAAAKPAPPTLRPGTPAPYDPAQDPALAPAQGGPILRLYPVSKLGAGPAPAGKGGGPLLRLFPVSKLPGVTR